MVEAYTPAEFMRDYTRATAGNPYPGYPTRPVERLRIPPEALEYDHQGRPGIPFDPSQPWCLADYYPEHATEPLPPDRFIDNGQPHIANPFQLQAWSELGVKEYDTLGRPLHPHWREMLTGPIGAVTTPGYYYYLGPEATSDFLLVAPNKDRVLHGLLIEREDNELLAIPGGGVDKTDSRFVVAACRELQEETGITVDPLTMTCHGLQIVMQKIWAGPGADQRATLHSFPVGEAYVGILDEIPPQQPSAKTDAKTATWLPMSLATLQRLTHFGSHSTITALGIKTYEDHQGKKIRSDGLISGS